METQWVEQCMHNNDSATTVPTTKVREPRARSRDVPAGTGTARESKISLPRKKKIIIRALPHTSTAAVKVTSGHDMSAIGWLMEALLTAAGACVVSYRYR
jgi:hypothetical protein